MTQDDDFRKILKSNPVEFLNFIIYNFPDQVRKLADQYDEMMRGN